MRITAPTLPNWFARRSLPGPGSQNLAFTLYQLPPYSPIGNGWQVQSQWLSQRAGTTPQIVLATSIKPGVPAGQFFGYPLSNPNNGQG